MAEYYPLLARAVAGLPNSTAETRRAIYNRARTALLGQLRSVRPAIAEEDIERESQLLDDAITRIEDELAAGKPIAGAAPPASPPQAPAPPPPAASRPADFGVARRDPPPRAPLPPRPAPSGDKGGISALEAARARLAGLARPAAQRPMPPGRTEPPPPEPAAPTSAEPVPAASPKPQPAPPPSAASAPPASGPVMPTPAPAPLPTPAAARAADSAASQPASPPAAEKPGPTEAEIAAARISPEGRADKRDADGKINITLRKYGPRAEAAGVAAEAEAAAAPPPGRLGADDGAGRAVRPAAPAPKVEKERNFRPLLIGAPVALVVGAIAIFAYLRRDNPEELARLRPSAGVESAEQSAGKIVERIGGGQGARAPAAPNAPASPSAPASTAQTAPRAPTQAPAASAPAATAPSANQAAPAAQRAALLVDAPDDPQRVRTYVGNATWRLDNVSRGPGQPLSLGVRAEVDLPDAKLRVIMLIQKNTDDTLPASHTIELRFQPQEGGPIPGVAQISTPQMRKEDTPAGDALTGVPAQILRNFFLVGLTRGDTATARNIDLMTTRGWIDVPILLSDERIAKLTFEKGASGEKVLNEALEAWK